MKRLALALFMAVAAAGAQDSQRFARADTARLHRTLDSLARGFHGIAGYAVHNLDTGERLAFRGDSTFPTASLIKVAVLVALYDLVEQDSIRLDDPIRLTRIDKVPGSGVLQYMHDGIEVTVHDAAWLMITISDNTATNLLLDKVAIPRVWAKMEALGLHHTKVHAKSFRGATTSYAPDSSAKYGLGVTTPHEMARLFELMALGRAVSAHADSAMLDILESNTDDQMLQRYADGVIFAHKTGANNDMRTECGLFRLQSRVVVCALTKENVDQRWLIDNEAQVLLAEIGRAVLGAWPRR